LETPEKSLEIDPNLSSQIEELRNMTSEPLRRRYGEVFGQPAPTTNPYHLRRRIAWRLQVLALGDLSEGAFRRAAEIAGAADLKGDLPLGSAERKQRRKRLDQRLPAAGTELTRVYRDRTVVVTVLANGFEYEGQRYGSLSAVARAVTGTQWNGLVFFGLAKRGAAPAQRQRRKIRLGRKEHRAA